MKIIRDLKFAYFECDLDNKTVLLRNKVTEQEVTFNKVYTFSALRFLVSSAQRMTVFRRKKAVGELQTETTDDTVEE